MFQKFVELKKDFSSETFLRFLFETSISQKPRTVPGEGAGRKQGGKKVGERKEDMAALGRQAGVFRQVCNHATFLVKHDSSFHGGPCAWEAA